MFGTHVDLKVRAQRHAKWNSELRARARKNAAHNQRCADLDFSKWRVPSFFFWTISDRTAFQCTLILQI
jgi:hypothetical protein